MPFLNEVCVVTNTWEVLPIFSQHASIHFNDKHMAALKTKQTAENVDVFIERFAETEQRKADSRALVALLRDVTGFEPTMWGPSMIGFGQYHYTSERSRQEGDWFLVGFSPRKAALSLYVFTGLPEHEHLLEPLGRFKRGKACLYVNKLSDIDQQALIRIVQTTIQYLQSRYGTPQQMA